MSDEEFSLTPPDVRDAALNVVNNLLPSKSSAKYEASYRKFKSWCSSKKVGNVSENVLLAYFSDLVNIKKIKSSTLWSEYSMLKALISLKEGDDISKFLKLRSFLKKQGEGYVPKKSKVLIKEQFDTFLNSAPDEKYLATKVYYFKNN